MGMDYVQDTCKCREKKVGGRRFADFKGQNKVEVNTLWIAANNTMPFPNIAVLLSHLDVPSGTAR